MRLSIREQILQAAEAALKSATSPTGEARPSPLLVHRERYRPLDVDTLPAILVYAEDDPPAPISSVYAAPLAQRKLNLVCECRAQYSLQVPPDLAIDPLYVWCVEVLVSEKFGGLANEVNEQRTVWLSREGEKALAAAAVYFQVLYRTAIADPTKKDPKS